MGRRSIGHQPADERRGFLTSPATRFCRALEARYRRARQGWMPPVVSILRVSARPIRIENRVHIDARRMIVIAAWTGPNAMTKPQRAPIGESVITRLVARSHRDDGTTERARLTPAGTVNSTDTTAWRVNSVRRSHVVPTPPVPMVLARQGAGSATRVPTTVSTAGDWGPSSTAHAAPTAARQSAEPESGLARVDVNRLTDRVVAALDRRMLAGRERLRG